MYPCAYIYCIYIVGNILLKRAHALRRALGYSIGVPIRSVAWAGY